MDRPHPVRLRAAARSSGTDDDVDHLHLEGRFYAAQLPGGAPGLLLLLCSNRTHGGSNNAEARTHCAYREGGSAEACMIPAAGTLPQASHMHGLRICWL